MSDPYFPSTLGYKSRVEIRIEGQLDNKWSEWLGLSIIHTEQSVTILVGEVIDQAALYGLIAKLRDLGVKLLAIKYGDNYLP
jgi:hypothetical protein